MDRKYPHFQKWKNGSKQLCKCGIWQFLLRLCDLYMVALYFSPATYLKQVETGAAEHLENSLSLPHCVILYQAILSTWEVQLPWEKSNKYMHFTTIQKIIEKKTWIDSGWMWKNLEKLFLTQFVAARCKLTLHCMCKSHVEQITCWQY